MDIFEIAVGKFVPGLRIFDVSVVDSQMPFRVFLEAMLPDELVLFFG
jgi:hypothetical protein